ncbi:hypothetical protein WA158_007460 [Blastocystis sp. Blastoise]
MSVTGRRIVGIPTLILFEAEGHNVVVETNDGCYVRGILEEVEDNWNMFLLKVIYVKGKNQQFELPSMYIRGSQICGVILPRMLSKSPMFERVIRFRKGEYTPVDTTKGKTNAFRTRTGNINNQVQRD